MNDVATGVFKGTFGVDEDGEHVGFDGGGNIGKVIVSDVDGFFGEDVELLKGAIEDLGIGLPDVYFSGGIGGVKKFGNVEGFEMFVDRIGTVGDEPEFVMRAEGGEGLDDIFAEIGISGDVVIKKVGDLLNELVEGGIVTGCDLG